MVLKAVLALGLTVLQMACTQEQMYYSTQHWQRNECRKVRSGDDRTRCESRPTLTYEQYQEEREPKPKPALQKSSP